MKWQDINSSGAKITGRTIVKGNVYIIGSELATSQFCNYDPTADYNLLDPSILSKEIPSSAKNIFAGTAPAAFTAANGLYWDSSNLVELDSLYASGIICSLAPARTTSHLTAENTASCSPDNGDLTQGYVDHTTHTPGVLKNATARHATLPK